MILSRTIRLFLDSIGRSEEYEYYIRKFQSASSASFAVICPDYDSLSLQYMLRMELYPTVLLAGPDAAEQARMLETAAGPLFRFHRIDLGPEPGVAIPEAAIQTAREVEALPLVVADRSLSRAMLALVPGRVLFVRMRGELELTNGEKVLHFLERRPVEVAAEDRAVLELGRSLLRDLPGLHVAITSPANILKEIFTVKGAGTVIQTGHTIQAFTRRADVDETRLLELIEESFGRSLTGTDFLNEVTHFYLEAEYRGAVLLIERPDGCYLSKFAVGKGARGAGVAQELWEEARAHHPVIYWRSRSDNSINRWYARLSEGMQKFDRWTVFWAGARPQDLPGVMRYCLDRPADFE